MKSRKLVSVLAAICVMLSAVWPMTAAASDTRRRITSVKITVDDSLKKFEYDANDQYLPSISENDFSVPDNGQYEVDSAAWVNESVSGVGQRPMVILSLTAQYKDKSNGDQIIYYFGGGYNASSVSVSGGSFVSAKQSNSYQLELVIMLDNMKGTYSAPTNIYLSDAGVASWTAPANTSGFYKVTLYRDSSKVTTITTDNQSLNLYPYMTKAGSYFYEVQTVPYASGQSKYGDASDIMNSNTIMISDGQVSDGSGRYASSTVFSGEGERIAAAQNNTKVTAATGSSTGTTYTVYNASTGTTSSYSSSGGATYSTAGVSSAAGAAGYQVYNASNGQTTTLPIERAAGGFAINGAGKWVQQSSGWYFQLVTGQYVTNDWVLYNNAFYRLDGTGKMMTGLYSGTNGVYYLTSSGAMKTGWAEIGGEWYYFSGTSGSGYGTMVVNKLITVGGQQYYLDHEGKMRTGWVLLNNKYYYFYPEAASGIPKGSMARSTTLFGTYTIAADGHWVH